MAHDLVIRGGFIVDGTGAPGQSGDLAVSDGRIAEVGTVSGRGAREVDARRPRRGARLHRSAHALRRPAHLGPERLVHVVARRDDHRDRQLRLHAWRPAAPRIGSP